MEKFNCFLARFGSGGLIPRHRARFEEEEVGFLGTFWKRGQKFEDEAVAAVSMAAGKPIWHA